MIDLAAVAPYIAKVGPPVLFVTISGAHLYGFESADSDYDLRGAHITLARDLFRLDPPAETIEIMDKASPIEMDLVTHDVRKFFGLLLKNNGYVLEQVFSPIVLHALPEFDELRTLARGCITRNHHHHFRRFAENQWDMVFGKAGPSVKGLLYAYRPLLAGIHLLTTGEVESNIVVLNERFRLSHVADLVAIKRNGAEKGPAQGVDVEFHEREFTRLRDALEDARTRSTLPEQPSTRDAIDDLLVRLRLKYGLDATNS